MESIAKLISTPILNGSILAATGVVLYGSMSVSANVFGISVPGPVVDFALGAASSFVADIATDYVLPTMSKDTKVQTIESKILNPALAGAVLVGLNTAVQGSFPNSSGDMIRTFLLGAGSELGSLYLYSTFKDLATAQIQL